MSRRHIRKERRMKRHTTPRVMGRAIAPRGGFNKQLPECIAVALAVLAVNKPRDFGNLLVHLVNLLVRAERAQEYYPKFLHDRIKRGIKLDGITIEESTALRATFARVGTNKGD